MREATVAIIKDDQPRKDTVIKIIKEHFKPDSILKQHLECYRSLYENQNLPRDISEKVLREAKMSSRLIDPQGLFKQQTDLINDINADLSSSVFSNFVPNYKTLATIDQIFCDKVTPKSRVMLENTIVDNMTKAAPDDLISEDMDDTTIKCFVEKFNEKYSQTLAEEQKELLTHYITSFTDNAVGLKSFLNEEISRLKKEIAEHSKNEIFQRDSEMQSKTVQIVEKLDTFKKTEISEDVLLTVLRTQELAKELSDGSDH
jgi:hypothetical protein